MVKKDRLWRQSFGYDIISVAVYVFFTLKAKDQCKKNYHNR